ncbi:30S ribosomal protein S3 [Candidatus Azambacteria bacterium RIFCSPHIGHO2_02_FULL_52_12]|uniref:Small ribosomal subunit protein uS3 n=1 Tax=Candidatus Azambacteria bacterium RIFCSPLOWO2_01_FULL_46_25 TaxID=1797298 RepID=A0A1F5BU68_9BACT|nr:MAG: 30S ribosomal protein S3 [Candidatus Azambacteria bacterium RIFCSPHIGHO2_02_FULL_52_12]OGD34137.1 MAG: 30S ribosomal protein S3 [Candidatus Azambacteria bacterium RIFCSPLOWO2_01_FULL_46_25]OGD36736.1 MAG: 30S ribosomal protein S3 [Candidatus Azambacteria bacterium RIFCSPHIGHO2_01_FULL_51_74]
MGRKVNPFVFRLGVTKGWKSRWFDARNYTGFLKEDYVIRSFLTKKLVKLGLEKIEIERSANRMTVIIFTSRPGLIIGKGGGGIEALKNEVTKKYNEARKDKKTKTEIRLQIEEVSRPDSHAQLVAQQAADQLEKRIPFRRILKQTLEKVMQNKEVKGAKMKMAGRLDGSEMSRVEWLGKGKMPLQTLMADIDYAKAQAYCTYGVIGITVWIHKEEMPQMKSRKTE